MDPGSLAQMISALHGGAEIPSSSSQTPASSASKSELQLAVEEAQAIFSVKWQQANQAWEVLQNAKMAQHNKEMADLQKEAERQLKIQKLVEHIKNQREMDKLVPPAPEMSEEQVLAFNKAENELEKKRKASDIIGKDIEKRQKDMMEKKRAAEHKEPTSKDEDLDLPKPKARPKAATELTPENVARAMAKWGLRMSVTPMEKKNPEKKKEPIEVDDKKETLPPPKGPPPPLECSYEAVVFPV